MSGGVVRTHSTRRHTRNNNASPYARPSSKKSSGWSLTGILNYLNPFGSRSEEEGEEAVGEAALRLGTRGQEIQPEGVARRDSGNLPYSFQPPQPPSPPQPAQFTSQSPPAVSMNGDHGTSPHSDESQSSSSANLKKVQQFLDEKAGKPLNHVELAGLVHLLQNSVEDDDDHPEPFRFSKSPSTPVRGTTPNINFLSPTTSEQMASAAGTTAQGARKTLARNPMGVYRWQGGGSARPRNRYHSPTFGSQPPRTTIKLAPEKPKTDGKRRRVGEEATSSSPQRAGATSASKVNGVATSTLSTSVSAPAALGGPPSTNGSTVNGRPNGGQAPVSPSTPRIRTTGIKPTAPAVPSPLRQTWGQAESPPQASPPQSASKPTRAAHFMTELLKEVTPPKKPDFANPYEMGNPIVRPPPKKQPIRKTRAAAKAETAASKKGPELTPQAIIEATVPKGSKRSRPPPELIGVKPSEKRVTSPPEALRRSTRLNGTEPTTNGINGTSPSKTPTVEEVTDEESPSPTKKPRTVKSPPPAVTHRARSPIIIEEVSDVEMSSAQTSKPVPTPSYTLPSEVIEPGEETGEKTPRTTSPTPVLPSFGGVARTTFGAKTSAPKAPSKLRFSIQVDKEEKVEMVSAAGPAPAVTPSLAHVAAPSFGLASEALKPMKTSVTAEKPRDVRSFVAAVREDELPKYSFTLPLSSPGAGPSTLKAQEIAKASPLSSLTTYDFSKSLAPTPQLAAKPSGGFNWVAAGAKPPSKTAGNAWVCSTCMLSNPGSATEKCTVCDTPRADKPEPVPVQGFNWAAAGMKAPPKPEGGQWTCGTCMLKNPSDVAKCTVCDTPR